VLGKKTGITVDVSGVAAHLPQDRRQRVPGVSGTKTTALALQVRKAAASGLACEIADGRDSPWNPPEEVHQCYIGDYIRTAMPEISPSKTKATKPTPVTPRISKGNKNSASTQLTPSGRATSRAGNLRRLREARSFDISRWVRGVTKSGRVFAKSEIVSMNWGARRDWTACTHFGESAAQAVECGLCQVRARRALRAAEFTHDQVVEFSHCTDRAELLGR